MGQAHSAMVRASSFCHPACNCTPCTYTLSTLSQSLPPAPRLEWGCRGGSCDFCNALMNAQWTLLTLPLDKLDTMGTCLSCFRFDKPMDWA